MSVKSFIDDINCFATIPHNRREIQDIQSAVEELLNRFIVKIEEHRRSSLGTDESCFPFKLNRTQLVGSMYEETGVWKYLSRTNKEINFCIEFDFLAIMEKFCDPLFKQSLCPGHIEMSPSVATADGKINTYRSSWHVNQQFCRSICRAIADICSCNNTFSSVTCSRSGGTSHLPELPFLRRVCTKCTVFRPTGFVSVLVPDGALLRPTGSSCSFTLIWKSSYQTIRKPDGSPCDRAFILLDFLPAFELSPTEVNTPDSCYRPFAVAKKCSVCLETKGSDTWRFSYNLQESEFIQSQISEGHKKCYKTLKYFSERFVRLSSYRLKTALLHHSDRCSHDDENECIFKILCFLESAYSNRSLKTWVSGLNLLKGNSCEFELKAIRFIKESFAEIQTKLVVTTSESANKYSLKQAHDIVDQVQIKYFKRSK